MEDSIHEKLRRVRKPRVHITYDLESNGVTEEKELPFVLGVLGDYSGHNVDAKKPLKDRKFAQVDAENFNDVMRKVNPKLSIKVANQLEEEGGDLAVDLNFTSMEDFEPHRLVEQVAPLKALLAARNKLRDLMSKADRSEELERILEEVLNDSNALARIQESLERDENKENN